MEQYLDEKLIAYSRSDIYPFHMPGHKRQHLGDWTPEEIDITEIDGFDNLHHAEGILRAGQRRLAKLCGADESFYLVNGSTCGLLAAICGVTKKGDRILMARNCHKAVYHAAYLMELKAEYLYPMPTAFGIQGSMDPAEVWEKLETFSDIAAVIITSPTYDGVVSDIAGIAGAAHAHGVPLIVDEAHGAHFGFSAGFPGKAITYGADLCIESFHKTLPSFTQTAVLHAMKTEDGAYRFDMDAVRRYLGIFQTSSPSYVLMAGMDRCVRMLEEHADSLFSKFEVRLRKFYEASAKLKRVEVFPAGSRAKDDSKILISASALGWSGQQLYDVLLETYHLQMEMASGRYVTALTTVMDTDEGFARLLAALREIDARSGDFSGGNPEKELPDSGTGVFCPPEKRKNGTTPLEFYRPQKKCLELAEAVNAPKETCRLEDAAGRISGEFIYLYPPGIPMLVPGELLSEEMIGVIRQCGKLGLKVQGLKDFSGETVAIIKGGVYGS